MIKRLFTCLLIALPAMLSAQITPGIYRLDYRYKEDLKWTIGEFSIEILKRNGTVEYMSLDEEGSCLIYESKSRWEYKDHFLSYRILKERFRDNCEDEFTITPSDGSEEVYEIIVIRKKYFIGQSQEDENLFMRWVSLDKNPIDESDLK